MITKILNFLLPLLKHFLNHKEAERKSNSWNDSEISEKKVETLLEPEIEFAHPVGLSSERITSPYGYRELSIDGKKVKQFHIGIDYGGNGPVFAVEDGIVTKILAPDPKHPCRFKKENDTWIDLINSGAIPKGRAWTPFIEFKGKSGNLYKYKHVDPSCGVGDEIKVGDTIGRSGNLGFSMGAHLHFEVWIKNKTVDPDKFLKGKKVK